VLDDRTRGEGQLVLPSTEERVRSRAVQYRHRQPETALLLDEEFLEEPETPAGQLPLPENKGEEAFHLVRTFRSRGELSAHIQLPGRGPLPATAEAFEGIDHFVIASGRIGEDAAGTRALRHWLLRGGKVWVMLDRVEPEAVAGLLGDALDFQVVDRVGLTRFTIETRSGDRVVQDPAQAQQHERPVDFARVLLPPTERPIHTVEGWPVWFMRRLGRGTVYFTTLGARAWYRQRKNPGDPKSPYHNFLNLPMPTPILDAFANRFHTAEEDPL